MICVWEKLTYIPFLENYLKCWSKIPLFWTYIWYLFRIHKRISQVFFNKFNRNNNIRSCFPQILFQDNGYFRSVTIQTGHASFIAISIYLHKTLRFFQPTLVSNHWHWWMAFGARLHHRWYSGCIALNVCGQPYKLDRKHVVECIPIRKQRKHEELHGRSNQWAAIMRVSYFRQWNNWAQIRQSQLPKCGENRINNFVRKFTLDSSSTCVSNSPGWSERFRRSRRLMLCLITRI